MRTNKGLADLIGKKVTDIEVVDYDHLGDGVRVDELYRITCDDGQVLHFLCDGGDCSHYGSISPVTLDEDGKVEGHYHPDYAKKHGDFRSLKPKQSTQEQLLDYMKENLKTMLKPKCGKPNPGVAQYDFIPEFGHLTADEIRDHLISLEKEGKLEVVEEREQGLKLYLPVED